MGGARREGDGEHVVVTEQMQSAGDPDSARLERPATVLSWALGITALLHLLPFGWLAIYPIDILACLLHEAGHVAGIEATGGKVTGVEVALRATGKTHSIGGAIWTSALAGYATVVAVGFGILAATLVEWSERALIAAGAVLFAGGVLWMTPAGSTLSFMAIGFGALLVAIGRHHEATGRDGSKLAAMGTLAVLIAGIDLALGGEIGSWVAVFASAALFIGFGYLATRRLAEGASLVVAAHFLTSPVAELATWVSPNRGLSGPGHSDVSAMAHWVGGPAALWAAVFAAVAVGVAVLGVVVVRREG